MRISVNMDQGAVNGIWVLTKAITGALIGLVAGWGPMVQALLGMMVIDFLTGVVKAVIHGKWLSEVGRKGVGQKILMLLLVAACHLADKYLQTEAIGPIAAGFYCLTEFGSILENLGEAGVPVPAAVRKALQKLQQIAEIEEKKV